MLVVTLADRPDLVEAAFALGDVEDQWPFMRHDETGLLHSDVFHSRWATWALALVDEDEVDSEVVARAITIPFALAGGDRPSLPASGFDGILRWAAIDALNEQPPDTLAALEITVARHRQHEGLSALALRSVIDLAMSRGLAQVVCPVRPTEKALAPRLPIEVYATLTRDDGLPVDPWLRTHVRAGGEIVGSAPFSMVVHGSLAEWRSWTGLPFDADGPLEVPGALYPVDVSVALDRAVYVEPNIWVRHTALVAPAS